MFQEILLKLACLKRNNFVQHTLYEVIRYIFVYDNGIAKKIDVQIGKRFDDKIEIVSDQIKLNDQLIIAGHNNLVDGAKVTIAEN